MKKIRLLLLSAILMLALGVTLSACGGAKEPKADGIKVVAGSVDTIYLQNETVSLEGLKLTVTKDGVDTTVTYNGSNIAISSFSTAAVGKTDVTFTYQGQTDTLEFEVVAVDIGTNARIVSHSKPQNLADYEENIKTTDKDAEEVFLDLTQGYSVGTVNEFRFVSGLRLLKTVGERYESTTLDSKRYNTTIYPHRTFTLAEVTGTTTTTPVTDFTNILDTTKAADGIFKFKSGAEGKAYVLTTKLKEGDFDATQVTGEFSITINVTKGFNAYDFIDLTALDNVDTQYNAAKEARGITNQDHVILHSNLDIVKSDLPASYFHSDGSLRDWRNIIHHRAGKQGEFSFNGNYFTISVESIPFIVYNNENESDKLTEEHLPSGFASNSYAFYFSYFDETGNGGAVEDVATDTKGKVSNLFLTGNAGRANSFSPYGGVQGIGTCNYRFDYYNVILTRFVTSFNVQTGAQIKDVKVKNEHTITKCRSFDTYSVAIYIWDAYKLTIAESELYNSGGPVIDITDAYEDDVAPSVYVDDLDSIHTTLSGLETWFRAVGADSAVPGVKALDVHIRALTGAFASNATLRAYLIGEYAAAIAYEQEITVDQATPTATAMVDQILKTRGFIQMDEGTEKIGVKIYSKVDALGSDQQPTGMVYENGVLVLDSAAPSNSITVGEAISDAFFKGAPILQSVGNPALNVNSTFLAVLGQADLVDKNGIKYSDTYTTSDDEGEKAAAALAAQRFALNYGFCAGDLFNIFTPFNQTTVAIILDYQYVTATPA